MVRKGKLADIVSKALYDDDPNFYVVGYLDFGKVKESLLPEFLKISENFETIPATRIVYIKRENKILFNKIMK